MVQATSRRAVATSRRTTRVLAVLALVVVVVIVALILGVVGWSGASLSPDASALARITLSPLAGSLSSAQAFGPGGRRIPLAVDADRLTPLTTVAPGERITVDVTVRRPGWIGWALGATHTERLELRAPVAHPDAQWLTVAQGSPLVVRFDRPVFAVAYRIADRVTEVALDRGQRVVALPRATAAGSLQLAASAASWERLGAPTAVSWFPPSSLPVVVVDPAPGVTFSPAAPIRLTFSARSATSSAPRARSSSASTGVWREVDSHTLVFQPAGVGPRSARSCACSCRGPSPSAARPAAPHRRRARSPGRCRSARRCACSSCSRRPATCPSTGPGRRRGGADDGAQIAAAVDTPAGTFGWRYPNTPARAAGDVGPGQANNITRGAVMMFENEHGLAVDGIAGPAVWRALIGAAIAGTRHTAPYSYVYVHRNLPQRLTLWSAGRTVLTSPGNTGVPAADGARHVPGVRAHPGRDDERDQPRRLAATTIRASAGSATSTAGTRCTPSTARPSARRRASAASSCRSPPPRRCGPTPRSARSSRSRTEGRTPRVQPHRAASSVRLSTDPGVVAPGFDRWVR